MKACPFCAEDIQDAAIVCKHCGRNIDGAGVGTVTVTAVAKKKTHWLRNTLMILGGLFVLSVLLSTVPGQSGPSAVSAGTTTLTDARPDEPCRVEGTTAQARAAAQNWCQGGLFTVVSVSADAGNFVASLQFSSKGYERWTDGKDAVLNLFRQSTDEIATTTNMNTAVSLHDTHGQMVGGCVRQRRARESTCK